MQTGADMFSAQITVGIPANTHIAALRDDFLEFCDGLNLDAIILNRTKLCEPLLERAASALLVQLRSRAHVVDPSFEKTTVLVEKVESNELSARISANGRNERRREKELATVREATNVTGVVVIMIYRDESGLAHGGACGGLTVWTKAANSWRNRVVVRIFHKVCKQPNSVD